MRLSPLALLAAAVLLAAPSVHAKRKPKQADTSRPHLKLNGEIVNVRWSDGDSFKITSGKFRNKGTRLAGYNTLESYGLVHQWGDWTWAELYELSIAPTRMLEEGVWNCTTDGKADGYGRLLVRCPDAAAALIKAGYAFVFAVDEKPDPKLLKLQHEAQKKKVGMWARGVPARIVSSLHSFSEGEERSYNRVVDTRTGKTEKLRHKNVYETCQKVCVGEEKDRSCMMYVPFGSRYRAEHRAPCLDTGPKE